MKKTVLGIYYLHRKDGIQKMDYVAIIIITFISGVVGTGLGGLIGAVLNRNSNKIVSLLLAFAGGVMLSVVCFDLIENAIATVSSSLTILYVIISISVGYLSVWGLNVLIDKKTNKEVKHIDSNHPKTADDLDELIHSNHLQEHKINNENLFVAGLVMMCAISLHNLPEGMVIGASYAQSEDLIKNLFSGTGFLMALIIGLHNIPEGMAVSVPLVSGGMKKSNAILLTALSGLPTIIGALLGYLIGAYNAIGLLISLGFASGAMLYVILGELLPEAILMWKSKLPALAAFIGMLLGLVLVNI